LGWLWQAMGLLGWIQSLEQNLVRPPILSWAGLGRWEKQGGAVGSTVVGRMVRCRPRR